MFRATFVLFAAFSLVLAGGIDGIGARADIVTGSVSAGTLKLKGDADANNITLDPTLNADEVRVTGQGTMVNGDPTHVFQGISGGLQIDLGAGGDTLTLDPLTIVGPVKIKMGAGDDTVTITTPTFANALSIDLGSGDNVLQLCGNSLGSVAGLLSVKVGAGAGAVHNATCDPTMVSIAGSALVIDSLDVMKTLSLKGSKKSEAVTLNAVHLLNTASAKLTLGGGSDAVSICRVSIGDSLNVKMGNGAGTMVTASCGGLTDPSGDNALDIDASSIASKLSVKTGASADTVLVNFTTVGGSATLDLGQGDNTLTFAAADTVAKNLSIKAGKGDDTIHWGGVLVGAGLPKIKPGKGVNTVIPPLP